MNWRGRRSLPTPMSSNASDWGERTFELQISWPQFLINISFCARAKFQLMLQKPKDALEDIHKVLKWRQDDFHGLCIRADIFQELGQFEKSLLVWQRVKKIRPRCTLVRSVTWFLSVFFFSFALKVNRSIESLKNRITSSLQNCFDADDIKLLVKVLQHICSNNANDDKGSKKCQVDS